MCVRRAVPVMAHAVHVTWYARGTRDRAVQGFLVWLGSASVVH